MTAPQQLLVAGGGIGAMAAACAVARAGWQVRVFERTPQFAEVGAGLQLGPNVTRILHAWGLQDALHAVAAVPERLVVRNAASGAELGVLPLGARALQRYGAPYVTVHRADLHALLLAAAQATGAVQIRLDQTLTRFQDQGAAVRLHTSAGGEVEGDALLGADGLLSTVRQHLLGDGPPQPVGDLAYRAMLRMDALPAAWHAKVVTVWMGTDLHLVHYPVRAGAALNVVAIVRHAAPSAPAARDDEGVHSSELVRVLGALGSICAPLRELVEAAPAASLNPQTWRRWVLAARPPVGGAAELAQSLAMDAVDVPTRLRHYAQARWQRVARVQARSMRNGEIFHARGLVRVGRDASIRLLGERLLDVPWLYSR